MLNLLSPPSRLHPLLLAHFVQICVNYLITLIPTRGKEKSKNILLNSQILSDEEAFYTSNLLRSLGLTQEAHSVLVQRGLYWLQKSLRQPTDSTSQLYRKGGMETKALSFFINGLDGRRARSLIDHSLRRCMVALTQSPHLISHLHVKYQSIEEILPSFPEAIHETATKEIQLHSQVISNPLVEINISSGLICAIDETIGVTLCGPEGVFLRYYIEATQTLVTLFQSFTTSSSIATTSATPSSENYEEILHHLHQLTSISIPLKFLIGPSQSLLVSTPPTTASTPSITPFTCQLSCLGRYYLHIIDLIILIDQFYNLKYEQLDKIITDNYFSPVEYDHITAQYNSLVIILFQKKEMEVLLQMVQSLSNNCYLIVDTNNYHGVDEHGGDEDLSKRKSKRKRNIELLYSGKKGEMSRRWKAGLEWRGMRQNSFFNFILTVLRVVSISPDHVSE